MIVPPVASSPPPVMPEVREVRTPMGTWSYGIRGERRRPGDPDILLLHGLFIDSTLWRAQVGPLAQLGRVVTLDLPGHGRSEIPPPFDLNQNADALAQALPSMGIARAVCVGWSWGGALSLLLALAHPARVAALALLDTNAEAQAPYRKLKYRLLVGVARRFGLAPWLVRSQIVPLMLSARSRRERPDLVEGFVRSATDLPRDALVRVVRAVAVDAPDLLGRLGGVTAPALVLCGREDRGCPPALSAHIAAALPAARLELIDGAGHLSPLERPEEVNRVLIPFVEACISSGIASPRPTPS